MREVAQMEHMEEQINMAYEDGLETEGDFADELCALGLIQMPELDRLCMEQFGIMPSSDHTF